MARQLMVLAPQHCIRARSFCAKHQMTALPQPPYLLDLALCNLFMLEIKISADRTPFLDY